MKRISTFSVCAGILLLGIAIARCQQTPPAGTPEVWGGQHVSMVISQENSTLEFDCAEGIIMSAIHPDAGGNFTASGTYTPQRGGPVQKDAVPNDLPATYEGNIQGDTMHLKVVLVDKSQQPPPLTLMRGKAGRVVKCR
jgi:hypothetical protein